MKERGHKPSELQRINRAKPVIPERKSEKAKKHIRRSGKLRRRKAINK